MRNTANIDMIFDFTLLMIFAGFIAGILTLVEQRKACNSMPCLEANIPPLDHINICPVGWQGQRPTQVVPL